MSSRRSSELLPRWAAGALAMLLASAAPWAIAQSVAQPTAAGAAPPDATATAPSVTPPVAPPRSYPARAVTEYGRALELARRGDVTEAELEFGQLAAAYPDFAGPQINIGLLRRKAGNLEASEQALRLATERNPASATAWTELGVTLRLRGQFDAAADAYRRAIAANPGHAAAHRNLGVVLDLYLDRPVDALAAFERYRELNADDKQASAWVAELKQRVARLQTQPATPPAEGT
jgi:tetratricopeptide (TPR) repeat protein